MRCKYILESGEQCGANALKAGKYCISHDPQSRNLKREACRRGGSVGYSQIRENGENLDINSPEDIKGLLIRTIRDVRNGTITPKVANSMGFLIGKLLQTYEYVDLDRKVEKIKSLLIGND